MDCLLTFADIVNFFPRFFVFGVGFRLSNIALRRFFDVILENFVVVLRTCLMFHWSQESPMKLIGSPQD